MTSLLHRLLTVIMVVGFIAPIFANDDIDIKIRRVQASIDRAAPIVERSGNERAKAMLDNAKTTFQRAVALRRDNKLREANAALEQATDLINKAVELANQGNNDIDAKIRRVQATIDRAAPIIRKSGNERAIALFQNGLTSFERAKTLARENKIREANAALEQATDLINKAVELANQSNNDIEAKIRRVQASVDRAAPIIRKSGNERAIALFQNAQTSFERGKVLARENKIREANAALEQATDLINKAVEIANQSNNDINAKIRRVQASIDRAAPIIRKSGNERAIALFQNAQTSFERGKALARENKIREANALLDKAAELVNQAVRLANQNSNNLDKMIERVGNQIERAKKIVRESGNERAAQVLQEAISHFDKAKRLNNAGREREAAAELDVASKLTTKAINLANGNNPTNIERVIRRVGMEIDKAKKIVRKSGNERAKKVLEQGIEHHKRAIALHRKGDDRSALAQLKVSSKLVAKAIRIAKGNDPERLDKAIKRLGERIERAKVIVRKSGKERAMKVLEQGIGNYNKAVRLNKAGKKREAAVQLKVASKLVSRAIAIANGDE